MLMYPHQVAEFKIEIMEQILKQKIYFLAFLLNKKELYYTW